ncbi:MAG: hypothetical protein IT165_21475 [Bryobacterales bacterium]|nr:hypothetical protein [Bryobacterales bacterium]
MLRFLALLLLAAPAPAQSLWNGYEKREFAVDGVKGYVVLPRMPAPGNPWLWRARFPEYHPDAAIALLGKGLHIAYYDLPNIFGSPKAVESFDHFYAYVTQTFRLSPKVALEGVSRGGLFVYNWALKNPEKISCIYCESPVCDMKSWPGGRGKGIGSAPDWKQALESFGFTEPRMLAFRGNPLDNAAALGAYRIPALHIVDEHDKVVPPEENTAPFAERYRSAGGAITVHYNTSLPESLSGHHFPIDDPAMVVNFILSHTAGRETLAGSGMTPHGVDYFHLREGLRNSLARFSQGGPARVVFLGGSITHMTGWRDMVCRYLGKRFPQTQFDCVDAGIPSTGSTPGAFRLQRDVFSRGPVDLLFEEAAVNDDTNGFGEREQLRGMEGIVRHARLLNPSLDIVLLHFADPGKLREIRAGRTPLVIRTHERVAEHYGLPSLDLAREVSERIDAGEFTWERDFLNLHPSPFGQTVYFRSIQRLLEAAWKDPAMPSSALRPYPLPPPLDEKSYFRGRLVPVNEANPGAGWSFIENWKSADGVATRPGFVDVPALISHQPGAECRFSFDGTAVGIFVAAGPDAGIVEYSIDNQPFQPQDLLTQWSPKLHIPWAYVLSADLPPSRHELRLRVSTRKNPQSTGHAIRIIHLLVN